MPQNQPFVVSEYCEGLSLIQVLHLFGEYEDWSLPINPQHNME